MKCQLPGHKPLEFASYEEYDTHYRKTHVNRCSECNKNFPSELILNLHLAEIHDPINEARKARGEKIYACFAEGCDKKCSAPNKRRMHMVSKHHFPEDFDFTIIKDGIDGRNSMLRGSRKDTYMRQPKMSKAEKAKAKAEKSDVKKKTAKTHTIFDEDGTTPRITSKEAEINDTSSSAMDIVKPTDEETPSADINQDVEMKINESSQPNGLAASKHATDPPRSAIINNLQKNRNQKADRTEATHDGCASNSTGFSGTEVSSQALEDMANDSMEGLITSMSALKFVPPSIRFGRGRGRGKGRGGFARS